MNVYVKVHKACNDVLVAMCDTDVLGKEFREGELHITPSPSFYKGKLIPIEECERYFAAASILNLVGTNVVERAISAGYIDREHVLTIGGTVHAQMVVV
ncbi:DUF424 family protein [archaeon]|nr:MAG: DUF424 family protein [archaeon]